MPPEIRAAVLLWLTALVVLETGLGLVAGSGGLRLAVLAVALVLVGRMAAGRRWARHALTAVFGLVVAPWLAAGALWWLGFAEGPAEAPLTWLSGTEPGGVTAALFATSVISHVAAVAAAVVYMYRPAANRYFRDSPATPRPPATTRVHVLGGRGAAPAGTRQPAAELR